MFNNFSVFEKTFSVFKRFFRKSCTNVAQKKVFNTEKQLFTNLFVVRYAPQLYF